LRFFDSRAVEIIPFYSELSSRQNIRSCRGYQILRNSTQFFPMFPRSRSSEVIMTTGTIDGTPRREVPISLGSQARSSFAMLVPWKQLRASWVIITNRSSLESYAHVYTCRAHKRIRSHRWAELLPRAWASSAYYKDGWPRKSIGGAHSLVFAFHFSFSFFLSFSSFLFSPPTRRGSLRLSLAPRFIA